MQYIVSQSFANKVEQDPLVETETLEDLALYLSKQGLSAEATNRYSRLLSHRRFVGIQRTAKEPIEEVSPEVMKEREIEVSEEEEEQRQGVERNSGATLQAWNAERTKRLGEALGTDTKTARERVSLTLESGFVRCGFQTQVSILHHLGSCHMWASISNVPILNGFADQ